MNWVDFLIIGVLLYTIWQGVLRGWVAALVGIVVLAAAWLVTILLLPYYGPGVESLPLEAAWARTIAFGLILVGFYVIFTLITNAFLGGKRPKVEAQIAGAVIGAARGLAASMAILGLLAATPAAEALIRDINTSRLGSPILEWERRAMARFPSLPPIGPDRRI